MSRYALTAATVATRPDDDTVVVNDGRVEAITRRERLGSDLPIVSHGDAALVPAFIDSHIHPLGYAALVGGTSLSGARDHRDLNDILREAAAGLPPGQALMAQRMNEAALGRLPTRHDLDAAVADRPVIAYRYCGHVAVLNSEALRLAGVDRRSADPPGGAIDRDPSGQPTGVLRETAVEMVGAALEPLLPPPSPRQVLDALAGLVAVGIHHVGGMVAADQPLWCGVGNELGQLCELAEDLPLRIDVMVIADTPAELESAAERIEAAGGRLRFWGWKAFADGSLGGHTAAMWDPYVDVETTGLLRLDPDHAERMGRLALDLGGVVAIHAIGDRAVDGTLDLFDRLIDDGADPSRLRMEHASVVSDTAVERLADRGVVASVQPSFLTSESDWVPTRLGSHRRPYRFATMHRAGVRMIGGSDSPVERPDPLAGIAAATGRKGWADGERLSLEAALSLYTTAPAEHFGLAGPLTPGSEADLVVVAGEPGTEAASVAAVYLAGERQEVHPAPWPD